MSTLNRRQFAGLAAGGLALPLARGVFAQARPEVARILVPFPPGGTTDGVARLLGEQLRGDIAKAVVVDNRTGAAGRIAVHALKQAPADGLSLLVHAGAIQSLYPHVLKQLGYEPWTDVAPVSTLCRVESCLAVGPAVPASVRTLKDWLAWAGADKKSGAFATGGAGTPGHLLLVVLGQQARVELTPVHYRSGSIAFPDVYGGQIPAIAATLNDAVGQLPTGKIRILGTSGDQRSALAPDVPTFAEQGFPQLVNVDYFTVFMHGATPAAVQERISASVRKALASPALVEGFKKLYIEPAGSTPQEAVRWARASSEFNSRMVKAVGYIPD